MLNSVDLQLLLIASGFIEAAVLAVTVIVLTLNFNTIKNENKKIFKRLESQSNIEKYNFTFKIADWIKHEIDDYLPYIIGDQDHPSLDIIEIKTHFDYIVITMITLIKSEYINKSLMHGEIRKIISIFEIIDDGDVNIAELRMLLK